MRVDQKVIEEKKRTMAKAIIDQFEGSTKNVKVPRKYDPSDYFGLRITVDGTEVTVKLREERSGGTFHTYPTGNVQVQVGDYTHKKIFKDRKAGHDFPGIAAEIIKQAEDQVRRRQASVEFENKRDKVQTQVQRINAELNAKPYSSDVWVSEEKGHFVVNIPRYHTNEARVKLLAHYATLILAGKLDGEA